METRAWGAASAKTTGHAMAAPFATRVFHAGFAFLLVWTMGCHVASFLAWPFLSLYGVGAAAVLAAVWAARRQVAVFSAGDLRLPELRWRRPVPAPRAIGIAALLGIGFLAAAASQYKFATFTPVWVFCLMVGAAALLYRGRLGDLLPLEVVATPASSPRPRIDLIFACGAGAMVIFYLVTSIPDADDSLFLNLAVGAKEAHHGIFAHDTMLGLDGLRLIKSTYLLESYPLLAALLSHATGGSVIAMAHLVIPVLICIWSASVLTLIHAALFPQGVAVTLGLHLVLLVVLDGALQSFGYHGVARFFHGKGPFVTTLVPLTAVLSVMALWHGSGRALWMLAGACILSMGLTANAVYVAPLCAALIGVCFLIMGGAARARAFRLVLIVLYPGALAVYLLIFDPPAGSEFTSPGTINGALWSVFSTPMVLLLSLGALFLGVCLPLFHRGLTAAGLYTVLLLALVLNPFLWPHYGAMVTGNINYRLLWAVPVPLIAALGLGMVWMTRHPWARVAVLGVMVLGLLSPGALWRQAAFGLAVLKVPPVEFALAHRVVDSLGPEARLLAPEEISAWVTVLEQAPHVVEGRQIYSPQRVDPRFAQALAVRGTLFARWSANAPGSEDGLDLMPLLDTANVSAVLMDTRRPHHGALRDVLAQAGFDPLWRDGPYRLLAKAP